MGNSPHTPSPSNAPHSPRSHSPEGGYDVTLCGGGGLDARARSQSPARGDGAEGGDTGGVTEGGGECGNAAVDPYTRDVLEFCRSSYFTLKKNVTMYMCPRAAEYVSSF